MPVPSFGIDHVVVLVRDLDAAAAAFEAQGFTLAPLMRHEGFGTANRIVLFQNSFLELVGVVAPEELGGPGLLIHERLGSHGPGPFGIALNADDIARDRDRLRAAGVGVGELGCGSRPVPLPDGTMGLARFSTFVIEGPADMPFMLFMSQQHEQGVVWIREWQAHANGVQDIAGLKIVTTDPSAWSPLLQALASDVAVSEAPGRTFAALPAGWIDCTQGGSGLASDPSADASRIAEVHLATTAAEPLSFSFAGLTITARPAASDGEP